MSYTAPLPPRHWHAIENRTSRTLAPFIQPTASTAAWPSANMAIYCPLVVYHTVVVRKLFFASYTTGTGNVDMGLYNAGGQLVVGAANAAKEAALGLQVFDVTDTTIGVGLYYLALSSDSSTDTFFCRVPAAPLPLAFGVLTEASAYPLPSTATFSANQTLAFIPGVGMTVEATLS